jgi:hypothetical protein
VIQRNETKLLLASDVDETLLAHGQVMQGELLSVLSKLLASERITLAIITGNDYVKRQRRRVVEPIPVDLRKNLVVYADGCTRKQTFTSEGQETLDETYQGKVAFNRDDKNQVRHALDRKLQEWRERYPEQNAPDLHFEVLDKAIQVKIGPIGEHNDTVQAGRDRLCGQLKEALQGACTEVQIIPSDKLWVIARCGALRRDVKPDQLRGELERLVKEFDLATATVIDRDEQLAIRPIRPQFRPKLAGEIRSLLSGLKSQTKNEYHASIGGRVTIDVQKVGVDKALAIGDLQTMFAPQGRILYFGDAFGPDGNDRSVAFTKGVTCLNVGAPEETLANVISLGGGPTMTLAYLRGILWALSGQTH